MKTFICLGLITSFATSMACAAQNDLVQIYKQAQNNDLTYKVAHEQFKAAKEMNNIAMGSLLPQLSADASITYNRTTPTTFTQPEKYHNNTQYSITIQQAIFNLGNWRRLQDVHDRVKKSAVVYAQAKQDLLMRTATGYFQVLEDEAKLRYAKKNVQSLKQQLTQTESQFHVGLKANTDVQSVRASFESGKSEREAAFNALHNDLQKLATITGQQEQQLAPLKPNRQLATPKPADPEQWVKFAQEHNLELLAAKLQAEISKKNIGVVASGGGSVPGYWPSLGAQGQYLSHKQNSKHPLTNEDQVENSSATIAANWHILNGGRTYYSIKRARHQHQASNYQFQETMRQTQSNVRQDYRNIISDISQVQALHQAVISGQSSVRATTAAYEVGTRTIVDLLTEQSNLFDSQQKYADAIFKYITDSLELKRDAGILNDDDIVAINKWLQPNETAQKPAKS